MSKINCDVNNCSYNSSGICFSNRVDIGGMASCGENDTCCGSFLHTKQSQGLEFSAQLAKSLYCFLSKIGRAHV